MSKNNIEIEFWASKSELYHFISTATRWSIDAVYSTTLKKPPFGMFDFDVKTAHLNYQTFNSQLNKKLSEANNREDIGIELKDMFIPMIDQYLNWHEQNKIELEKFKPYSPYEIMRSAIESTKRKILLHFPDKPQQTETEPLDLFDGSKSNTTAFKNNFDNVPESKVIAYFTENLVEKRYITEETLYKYLKQAFELKTQPIKRFSFENLQTKGKIRRVFYNYFRIVAGKPNRRKLEYVKLLGEYFNGFDTEKINTNFSK